MSAVTWSENETPFSARWHSENDADAPARITVVDDSTTAKAAYRMARAGTGLLWRGDYHNARQLLSAMDRLQRRSRNGRSPAPSGSPDDAAALFHRHRAERAERAGLLGKLLVVLEPDHSLLLRRAPDVRAACE